MFTTDHCGNDGGLDSSPGTCGLLPISRMSLIPVWMKQGSVFIFTALASALVTCHFLISESKLVILIFHIAFLGTWLLEFERVQNADAAERARLLRKDFSEIMKAACASESDKVNILNEIQESGLAEEVQHAVDVLLSTNSSTPELQRTVGLTGTLGDVTTISWLRALVGLLFWTVWPALTYDSRFPFLPKACMILMLLEAGLWLMCFYCISPLRKAFAAAFMSLYIIGLIVLVVTPSYPYEPYHAISIVSALFLGPLTLFASVAGPLRVARVPFVGVLIVQICLGRGCFACGTLCATRRPEKKIPAAASNAAAEVPEERLPETVAHLKVMPARGII